MKTLRALTLIFVALCTTLAICQYPTSPNTGLQTTPFNSVQFSATFNGPVNISDLVQNTAKTSQFRLYESTNKGVTQTIQLRVITTGYIAVDYTSSDFYANEFVDGIEDTTNRSHNVWEGYPFTYTYVTKGKGDDATVTRTRFIIINAREALFLSQVSLASIDNRDQWLDFEYSLRIK